MAETDFDRIKKQVRQFVVEREWDQFHSPKNLSMALIVEAAEMVEHFQWLTEEQSCNLAPEKLAEVEQELADIQIYLISLAEKLQAGPGRRRRQKAGAERAEIPGGQGTRQLQKIHGVQGQSPEIRRGPSGTPRWCGIIAA